MSEQNKKKRNNTSAISGLEVYEVRHFLATIRNMYLKNNPFYLSDIISMKCDDDVNNLNDLKKKFYNYKTKSLEIPANNFALMFRQGIHNKRHNKNKILKNQAI
jgi:hypothetical protein